MDTEHQVTLANLQEEFPAFYITLEPSVTGPRYIASRRQPNQNPHTLITRDPTELRAALAATRPTQPPVQGSRPVVNGPRSA